MDSQNVVLEHTGDTNGRESSETNEDRLKSIEDRLSRIETYIKRTTEIFGKYAKAYSI